MLATESKRQLYDHIRIKCPFSNSPQTKVETELIKPYYRTLIIVNCIQCLCFSTIVHAQMDYWQDNTKYTTRDT